MDLAVFDNHRIKERHGFPQFSPNLLDLVRVNPHLDSIREHPRLKAMMATASLESQNLGPQAN